MKKVLFTLFMLLPMMAQAVQVEINGINYELDTSTGNATVTANYPSYTGDIVIPSSVIYSGQMYSVTRIGDVAFAHSNLTSITIPNSITSIGSDAFVFCDGLTSMIVEEGNTKYDSRENRNCIIETATNTLIVGCNKSTISNSVTSIGERAFFGCIGLTSITIPNSVTSIGRNAFDASGLTSIIIPNSMTSIGIGAFSGCSNLASIIVENDNPKFDSRENSNCIIETATNTLMTGCKNTIIPSSVTSIWDNAFYGCLDLTSITIPNTITSIGENAFYGCFGLTSISIPNSVTSIGNGAFYQCHGLTSIAISNSVKKISDGVFAGCSGISSITIPNSVTSIENGAFYGCSSLIAVTIPTSVTNIGDGVFQYCSRLISVSIPNSVTSIGAQVFNGCTGLTSITIPSSITYVGWQAFDGCENLTDIYCLSEIPPYCFYPFIDACLANMTLHVPSLSISAYRSNAPWSSFGSIVPLSLNSPDLVDGVPTVNLIDGENYTNTEQKNLDELTFTKTFSASNVGNWNAFYVPMSIDVEEYAGELDFAEIYAFCATVDTNGDGTVDADDENFLFVRPVKTGCTEANVPYLIRPHEAKTYTINSADNILYEAESGYVEFATTRDKYTVTGVNDPFTVVANDNNYYVTTSGTLSHRTSGSTTVKANRWIMHRESKKYGNSSGAASSAKEYRIITLGEEMDEADAITAVKKANGVFTSGIYTLDGRKMGDSKPLPTGVYVKNGKKYIVK